MSEEKYVLEGRPCPSGSLCMGYNVNSAHVGAQYGCTQGCLRHWRIESRQRKTDNMTERERDTGVGEGWNEILSGHRRWGEVSFPSWLVASQFLSFYHSKLMIDKTRQNPVSNYWSQLWWVSVPKQWGCLLEHFTPSQRISHKYLCWPIEYGRSWVLWSVSLCFKRPCTFHFLPLCHPKTFIYG